MRTHVTSLPQ